MIPVVDSVMQNASDCFTLLSHSIDSSKMSRVTNNLEVVIEGNEFDRYRNESVLKEKVSFVVNIVLVVAEVSTMIVVIVVVSSFREYCFFVVSFVVLLAYSEGVVPDFEGH